MAVVEYKTQHTVVETRQLVIDDAAFTAEHGHPVAESSPAQLKDYLLALGVLEDGVIVASEDDGVHIPGIPKAVAGEQVAMATWHLDGFIYGDEIALLSVARHDPAPGLPAPGGILDRWDTMIDDYPGTQFNGPWANTIEVPVDATHDEVWAAARAAADEAAAEMLAAENKEMTP